MADAAPIGDDELLLRHIPGGTAWQAPGPRITSGNFHNQAAKGAESALSCMMARTAAYKGHEVTWDELMKSTEVWDPKIDLNKLA